MRTLRKSQQRAASFGLLLTVTSLVLLSPARLASAAPGEETVVAAINGLTGSDGCTQNLVGPTLVGSSPLERRVVGEYTFSCPGTYRLIRAHVCMEVQDPVWVQVGCGTSDSAAQASDTDASSTRTARVSVPCVPGTSLKYRLISVGLAVDGNSLWVIQASTGAPRTIHCILLD